MPVVDEDPREGLVARILEYKEFKIFFAMLAEREKADFFAEALEGIRIAYDKRIKALKCERSAQ